jgi:hypothetical protein
MDHPNWHGKEKNDLEAIKLLKEWCVWLVAIETAVIASIAAFGKNVVLDWTPGYLIGRILARATISAQPQRDGSTVLPVN